MVALDLGYSVCFSCVEEVEHETLTGLVRGDTHPTLKKAESGFSVLRDMSENYEASFGSNYFLSICFVSIHHTDIAPSQLPTHRT